MRIGIVGAGNIGGTIGSLWARAGHDVLFAVRRPEALQNLISGLDGRARIGSLTDAADFGPVLLFAAPYGLWPAFASAQGEALADKTVIDAANPYADRDGEMARDAATRGAGAYTAALVSKAHVVKAFNTIFWKDLRDQAHRSAPRLGIPLIGDDASALATAERLIDDAGYDAVRAGGLAQSRRVDPGAPVYAKSLTAEALRTALAADGFGQGDVHGR